MEGVAQGAFGKCERYPQTPSGSCGGALMMANCLMAASRRSSGEDRPKTAKSGEMAQTSCRCCDLGKDSQTLLD